MTSARGTSRAAAPLPWTVLGVAAVALVLAVLPGRRDIPPLVESDYCYLLTAADRFIAGKGLTTTTPVAPLQPWTWRGDWTFLTQWPIGYPLLVAAARAMLGTTTIEACRWLNVLACALAVVGWFSWSWRTTQESSRVVHDRSRASSALLGIARVALAFGTAGIAVHVGLLVNPSTDVWLIAGLPWTLLLALRGGRLVGDDAAARRRRGLAVLAFAGLLAGAMFWVRYASIFVPVGIFAYLALRATLAALRSQEKASQPAAQPAKTRWHVPALFALGAAIPAATLLLLNHVLGSAASTREQLNLGRSMGLDFSLHTVGRAWWMFTDLGYFAHRPAAHWLFAAWPVAVLIMVAALSPLRLAARHAARQHLGLAAMIVLAGLGMLVAARTIFGGKFDFVGLDRYYLPLKPLYFTLFFAPFLQLPRRSVHVGIFGAMTLACSWTMQQEWSRTYSRWTASHRPATPYGAWSRCFEPNATELFGWLKATSADDHVVVSNFHEYLALETGIPALPVPDDRRTLRAWLERIEKVRGVPISRVLFVLDTENQWRDYWIAKPEETIREFALSPSSLAPASLRPYVYDPLSPISYNLSSSVGK